MFDKISDLIESIDTKSTPTRDASNKASIALYRKAYNDYRDNRTDKTKSYLRGVQDLLLIVLGRSSFERVKQLIQSEYSKDKLR